MMARASWLWRSCALACPADAWRWNNETWEIEWEFTLGQTTYKFPIKRKPRPVGRPEEFCAKYHGVTEASLFARPPPKQRHGDGLRVARLNQTLTGKGQHRKISAEAEVRWRGKSIPETQCHFGLVWHLPTIVFADRYELDRVMTFRPGFVARVFEDWYWIGEKHAGQVNASALVLTMRCASNERRDRAAISSPSPKSKGSIHNRYPEPVETTDDWLGRAYVNATIHPPRVILSCGSAVREREDAVLGALGGEVEWEWLGFDSRRAPAYITGGVADGSGVIDPALGADVVIWTAPAGVRSHYRFVWWVTILSQYACAGIMCYATLEGAVAEEDVRKGILEKRAHVRNLRMPMSATHPGRKKLAQERAEREREREGGGGEKED